MSINEVNLLSEDEKLAGFVENLVVRHYDRLPSNGKASVERSEFTVLAAFLARKNSSENLKEEDFTILSVATGTKCVGTEYVDEDGQILHDSHAEVLARRGLLRFCCLAAIRLQEDPSFANSEKCPLVMTSDGSVRWRSDWDLWLYISDSPCGDGSIYDTKSGMQSYTGAKLVSSDASVIRESTTQVLGCVRTKSGRSDAVYRTSSMSCSDKICRWISLGLQGRLLFPIFDRIPLKAVVIGGDPSSVTSSAQLSALRRALVERFAPLETDEVKLLVAPIGDPLTSGFTLSKARANFKFQNELQREQSAEQSEDSSEVPLADDVQPPVKKRQKKKGLLPGGNSLNWQLDISQMTPGSWKVPPILATKATQSARGTIEVTTSHTGLPQGATVIPIVKGKETATSETKPTGRVLYSRLSRMAMRKVYSELKLIAAVTSSIASEKQFSAWKECVLTHLHSKTISNDNKEKQFFSHSVFCQWVRGQSTVESCGCE